MRTIRPRTGRRPYWVPRTCAGLRDQLRRMGVTKINGKPLRRVRKAQLYAVFYAMRKRGTSQLSCSTGQTTTQDSRPTKENTETAVLAQPTGGGSSRGETDRMSNNYSSRT